MQMRFNEVKATQLAALLLQLRGTGRMKYLKLLKLMYLVDREALARWGRPISTDRHVSMDKGPVLSRVYNLLMEEQCEPGFWSAHIAPATDHDVQLIAHPGTEELSRAEEELGAEIFGQHGHKNCWKLVDEVHDLPEWQDPHGNMIPIALRDILKAVGKSQGDIAAIEQELESDAFAEFLLKPI
ncbi:MAG TPA: Panacea domain-containing protein [Bryobacteraceae bacterium]|nr:Panacea domain-containing protein [Bryobacteraceae bacterium]